MLYKDRKATSVILEYTTNNTRFGGILKSSIPTLSQYCLCKQLVCLIYNGGLNVYTCMSIINNDIFTLPCNMRYSIHTEF